MRRVDVLLADYASYHRTKGNIVCHFIGVPLILFGILAVLGVLRLGPITMAEVVLVAALVFYFRLHRRLAVAMLIASALIDAAAGVWGGFFSGLAALAIGWIFQGIGHAVYEKNSPAFFRNLVHLMIGPIFLLNELFHLREVQTPSASAFSAKD